MPFDPVAAEATPFFIFQAHMSLGSLSKSFGHISPGFPRSSQNIK